jgi:signal transduction histidine kinase
VTEKIAKVLVSDTGRGIPLKQQSLLFHKFQQTGESLFTRDTVGGSGLGLYISKMMMEGMDGEVKLEKSDEKKGSVFSFTLPIAKNKVN